MLGIFGGNTEGPSSYYSFDEKWQAMILHITSILDYQPKTSENSSSSLLPHFDVQNSQELILFCVTTRRTQPGRRTRRNPASRVTSHESQLACPDEPSTRREAHPAGPGLSSGAAALRHGQRRPPIKPEPCATSSSSSSQHD